MEPKISVIIPVYNVENYVTKCIMSIINQTYKNLEIICINDGSTDLSGHICNRLSKDDNRIKVLHKKNGGVSSARNMGLQHATGEFIAFVDPDDWIKPEMYEILIKASLVHNADISVVSYFIDKADKSVEVINEKKITNNPFNNEDLIRYAFIRDKYKGFGAYLWNKLFRASLINNDNEIRFDESLFVGEDICFFGLVSLNTKYTVYIDTPMYHYNLREDSLFHSNDISKKIGSLYAYDHIINLFEDNKIDENIIIWIKRFYVYHSSMLLELCIKTNNIEKIDFFKSQINKYINEYKETNLDYPDRINHIDKLLNYNSKK